MVRLLPLFLLSLALALADFRLVATLEGDYYWVEETFNVPLDHFSLTREESFPIRFLYNDSWWDKENGGPIFFYTGNEGAIEAFAQNSGFMWDIAGEFGALLIFAEHRFYGGSSPPDTLKRALDKVGVDILGYLTVQQVLADYAQLLFQFKMENGAEKSPVIAFGGSYGGVLTAWMRLRYPHIVAGGIAASAPFFVQSVPCDAYDASLTSIFGRDGNGACVEGIRRSWGEIRHLGKSRKGRSWLSKTWKLCNPLETEEDIATLKNWLEEMYSFLAMANYPYPANFLQDLPANPVKEFCSHLQGTKGSTPPKELLSHLFSSINVYINNSQGVECFDYSDASMYSTSYSSTDDNSFAFQGCTQLIDPDCSNGVNDFFEPEEWNFAKFSKECWDAYKVRPDPNATEIAFGGKDMIAGSNIVFSNGLLDPWLSHGVLRNLSDSLVAIVIPDAAHHLDLRAANPADPPSVLRARELEKGYIRDWISQFPERQRRVEDAFAKFN